MNEPRQRQFLAMGEEGCYYFTITHFAEDLTGTYIDNYQTYLLMRRTVLPYPPRLPVLEENCYVNDPSFLLSRLTGEHWSVTKEELSYVLQPGELEVTRFEKEVNITTKKSHFVATDGHGVVTWNSMGGPLGPEWVPVSKRIFRRLP